jgi:hypothetical protein
MDLEALRSQVDLDEPGDVRIVVDDQHDVSHQSPVHLGGSAR